ncbi:MAG: ModE family transcriptional regulator [Burkholderiaceae bacterium]
MLTPPHDTLLSLRLRFHERARLGPGKIALLEAVRLTRSISAAATSMDMSARRAWLLIDSLNNAFTEPLVALTEPATPGESEASLTEFGESVIDAYRTVEADAAQSVQQRFAGIIRQLKAPPETS